MNAAKPGENKPALAVAILAVAILMFTLIDTSAIS